MGKDKWIGLTIAAVIGVGLLYGIIALIHYFWRITLHVKPEVEP